MNVNIRKCLFISVFGAFAARAAIAQPPTVWFVDLQNEGTENGTSWSTAFNTIEEAIVAADENAGDPLEQIWVKGGEGYIYKPTNTSTGFTLKRDIEIYGGFAGDEEPVEDFENNDPRAFDANGQLVNQTILSGEIGSPGISDNVRVIVTAPANDSEYICDGFVIEAAREHGLTAIGNLSGGSSGSFRNLIVRDNINDGSNFSDGGGMYVEGDASRPTIDKCLFARNESRNSTGFGGGAIYCFLASTDLSDTRFEDNMALGLVGGGAFHIPDQITSAPHQMSDGRDEISHVVTHVCHYV